MLDAIQSILRVAAHELADSIRSRRAIVLLVLYFLGSVAGTLIFIKVLHEVENEVAKSMGLEPARNPGGATAALWESAPFRRIVTQLVGDRGAAEDLLNTPPLALFYGWLSFSFAPLLVILTASARVAEDVWSGSVRFVLFRTSRASWCMGKYVGQACVLMLALLMSGLGSWLVGWIRMEHYPVAATGIAIFTYSAKAWVYTLAFLGLATGISQFFSSPNTATAIGFIALIVVDALNWLAIYFEKHAQVWAPVWKLVHMLVPGDHKLDLWRTDPAHVVPAMVFLVALGLVYVAIGHAWFNRRDL